MAKSEGISVALSVGNPPFSYGITYRGARDHPLPDYSRNPFVIRYVVVEWSILYTTNRLWRPGADDADRIARHLRRT